MRGGGQRERGGHGVPSGLHTVSTEPSAGLELTNCDVMTGAQVGRVPGTPKSERLHLPIALANKYIPLFPTFVFGCFRLRNIGAGFCGEEMLEGRWRLSGVRFKKVSILKIEGLPHSRRT